MNTRLRVSSAYARPFGQHFLPVIDNEVYTAFNHETVLGLLLQAKKHTILMSKRWKKGGYK